MMRQMILTGIGWLGVAFCTVGYLLLSTKVIKAESAGLESKALVMESK
jgi:hypothetical protein